MKCANCGREKEISAQDLIFAAMVEFGGVGTNIDFRRCNCAKNIACPKYWKANELTEDDARDKGELEYKIWKFHHSPRMRDCVTLDYGYHINKNGRIICDAQGDFVDITDEINEWRF